MEGPCHTRLKVARRCLQELREETYGWGAGSLVGDDLNALDVASSLEDLAQHVLGDPRVESTNVQGSFVRLGRGTARSIARTSTGAGGRHDTAGHGRADGSWDGVRVLRDNYRGERRRRHVLLGVSLLAIVARRTSRGRWRGQAAARRSCVGHDYCERMRRCDTCKVLVAIIYFSTANSKTRAT